MMQHFYCENGFLQEEVIGTRDYNLQQTYSYKEKVSLFDNFTEDIRSVLFCDIKRGVFENAKFDSLPVLVLARVLETETDDVENWLRPSPREFNITYNHGHAYEPDFVVETKDIIYLVEVKGEDKLQDPDVIAKKKRGIQYCEVASRWGKANGYKEWKYLFSGRTNADLLCGVAQVDSVNGIILLPDCWTCPAGVTFKPGFYSIDKATFYAEHQTFTARQWAKLEAAGAVFLPAAGYSDRVGVHKVQHLGNYWSATEYDNTYARHFSFRPNQANMGSGKKSDSRSVRLVKDVL
jgi:hypothetical protein